MAGNRGTRRVQGRMYGYDSENGRWRRLSIDEDGNITSAASLEKGGMGYMLVSDMDQNDLLGDILNQLKIMNTHLQSMTDEEFNNDS
jgi:hypothetical protein